MGAKSGAAQTAQMATEALQENSKGNLLSWVQTIGNSGKPVSYTHLDVYKRQTPESAMSLAEELAMLRKRVKDQDKEIRRLKEENEFLEEASAFFAASRRKSARTKE